MSDAQQSLASSISYEAGGNKTRSLRADRKADSLRAHDHRRVYANDFTPRIHQRPAGVAGIQSRVGLDHVLDQPARLRAHASAQRTYDTSSHGELEAQRIANRNRQLPHPRLRRTEWHRSQMDSIGAQHS